MTMTSASLLARAHDVGVGEEDPAARASRRTFTAEYKARVLAQYDALPLGSTERGALLRREGLYTSQIAEWRPVPRRWRPKRWRPTGACSEAQGEAAGRDGRVGTPAPPQRAARDGTGPDPPGVGDHGKSTRALGDALRERGHRSEVEAEIDEHFDALATARFDGTVGARVQGVGLASARVSRSRRLTSFWLSALLSWVGRRCRRPSARPCGRCL